MTVSDKHTYHDLQYQQHYESMYIIIIVTVNGKTSQHNANYVLTRIIVGTITAIIGITTTSVM